MHSSEIGEVSYEGDPILEVEFDGIEYRLDPGKQGTALSLSSRESGTWDWSFGGELRWDGSSLRCRALDRHLLERLAGELKRALSED